jgi:hypothetical protein
MTPHLVGVDQLGGHRDARYQGGGPTADIHAHAGHERMFAMISA